MDLTNLRQHHEELVNHMKNSGYSMSCIYMYKRQIREILDLDLESWTSYQDIYQYFVSISSNQKDLKWRRSVIGSIEYFDIYGLFPDRRRICSFIEPRGAYHSLNHVYQQLIDYYKTYAERIGKTKDTTIDSESHSGSVFFYHLQQRGCCNLESTEEDDVLSYFLDESGNLIRSAACCKSVRAVLKAGSEVDPIGCKKVLLFLPHLTEHRKNIQMLTDDEICKINQLLDTDTLSLRDKAIIVLHDSMLELMQQFNQKMDCIFPDREYFFVSRDNVRFNSSWLSANFRIIWDSVNSSHATAYDLRHNYAIENINRWTNEGFNFYDKIAYLSKSMGHVTLESTKYYYSIVPNLSSIMMNQTNETFDWIVPEVNTDEEIY